MDKALVNPIEDQRKEALRHYDEAARLANYWSSFVRDAILAYNPTTMDKQDKTAERYFKCWKCGKTLSLNSGITCTQPMAVRTSGMCGGSTTQEITKDEYFETLYKWSEDRTAELEAKIKELEEENSYYKANIKEAEKVINDGINGYPDHDDPAGQWMFNKLVESYNAGAGDTARLNAKIKALEERLEAADEVIAYTEKINFYATHGDVKREYDEALEKYNSLKQ